MSEADKKAKLAGIDASLEKLNARVAALKKGS